MPRYYVNNNQQDSEDGRHHEVHEDGCNWLKRARDTSYLGVFSSCHGAMVKAKEKYPRTTDGCKHCCPACNND